MSTGHGEGNLWATIDPQERCRVPPFLLTRWSSSGEVKVQEGAEGAQRAPGMAPGPGAGPAGEEAWSLRRLAGRVVSRLSTRWGQPAPTSGPAPRHQGDAASTSTYRLPAHRHSRSVATASDHNTTDSSYSASTTDSVEDVEEEEEEEDEGGEAEAEAGVGPERGAQQTLGRGRRQVVECQHAWRAQGAVASRAAAAARALERAAGGDQGSGCSPSPSPSPPRGAAPRSPAAAVAANFYARAAAVAAAAAAGSAASADDKRPATAPLHVPPLAPPPPPQSASAHLPYVLNQRARPPPPPSALASVAGSAGRGRRWSSVPQPQPLHEEPSRALCAAYASHSALPHVLHRRVPPASVMASPWWRSMEENSPAFAAISQRFHVIAHVQARERLATSMARLAAMQEQERASRESEDAMRFALGMPALARWAETKATAPLFSFFLRTAHALLDLALELIRHSVLVGWVLLGVFNRLLMELMTAKRSASSACADDGVPAGSGFRQLRGDLRGPPGLRRVVLGVNFFLPHTRYVHLVIFAAASCLHAPDG